MSYITGIHIWVGKRWMGMINIRLVIAITSEKLRDRCTVLQWVQCIWLLISCFAFLFVCQIFRKSGKIKFVFLYLSIYPHTHSLFVASTLGAYVCVCVCARTHTHSLSRDQLFGAPWTVAPPGFSVHGIFQARIQKWIVISYSRGSSQPRDRTHISCIS